jgi:hypothetical protein
MTMAKDGAHADTSKTAATRDEYIGRHRERTEIVEDRTGGWAVGRGTRKDNYSR